MPAKYRNWIPAKFLLSGALLCILGCNVVPNIKSALTPDPNNIPVNSLDIVMELEYRDEFFQQLRDFAEKHSLEVRLTFYDADEKAFLVSLEGDGFHITGGSNLYSPREIGFGFYNESSPPTPQETLDDLYDDLTSFLNEIPNIIIKEKIKGLKIRMNEDHSREIFDKLFNQLRGFADEHSLEFIVSSFDSDLEIFLIEMKGNSFQITSEAVLSPLDEINVDFYIHYDDNGHPTSTSQKTVDELFNDLKSFFGDIPSVMIEEVE